MERTFKLFDQYVDLYDALTCLGLYQTAEIICLVAMEEHRQIIITLYS